MDGHEVASHFERIGARARVRDGVTRRVRLDIGNDRHGQFFDVSVPEGARVRVIDVDTPLRHLVLLGIESGRKIRYLCGHDEREWFVAAVPGEGVARVRQAMEALKPAAVRMEQDRRRVRGAERLARRNSAYVRQGEWFFLPSPGLVVQDWMVLRNEPMRRTGGKPHWAELLYRTGGETVMVCSHRPNGVTLASYRALVRDRPKAAAWNWQPMRRNPLAYVKGTIRHPDHATIRLDDWHRVLMNTEAEAPGARNVAFLD